MAAPVALSYPAQCDLDDIWDHLAAEASPEIGDFVIARLYEAMRRAAENPLMYRETAYRGRPRRINVFEYAVFYEAQDGNGIVVLRIIHGRRHIDAVLGSR